MKTIPLNDALTILEEAVAILTYEGNLMYPNTTCDITGDPDNEFMYLLLDETRMVETIHFCEKGNAEVKISDSSMFLYDTYGKYQELIILVCKQLT